MKPQEYWRSLDELSASPEFERWLHAEFPEGVSEKASELHRRDFLRLMGASVALAGFGACTKQPIEKIVPYVKQPEEIVLGKPLRFATATTFGGYAQGIIVTSYEGRPTKIEGNPDHPASLGATSIWAQADVLDLYDPDRAQAVTNGAEISTWDNFLTQLNLVLVRQQAVGGTGVHLLIESTTSPTLSTQLRALRQKFPQLGLHQWDPIGREGISAAAATGTNDGELNHDFSAAKVVVALDSDFLYAHPAALRYARDFASARRVTEAAGARMNRLYVAEPTPTITGSNADHRLSVAARDVRGLIHELATQLEVIPRDRELPSHRAPASSWLRSAARDLDQNRGAGIVIVGDNQPNEVHALAAEINRRLSNTRKTISGFGAVQLTQPLQMAGALRSLVTQLNAGAVELLMVFGGNPVFTAPADFDFASAMQKAKLAVHHTLYPNETSRLCHWSIPSTHFLESWTDMRAFDGTVTIAQPLIEPLYEGKSVHELVDAMISQPVRSAYEIVREHWRGTNRSGNFESNWREALSRGVFQDPAPELTTAVQVSNRSDVRGSNTNVLEIVFRADPNILDGRYANNAWLQELPKPFSKITWDNAALVSPKLAERQKLRNGDYIELSFHGRKLDAPIWILPGQAENSITLHLGYGRECAGRVGTNKGYNAYKLRTSDALWFGDGVMIRKTGRTEKFATTQNHFSIEGRDMIRAGTLAQFMTHPEFVNEHAEIPARDETLYNPDEFKNNGYAWGMVIDLNTCIGCNACTIACQAENNIPVVGKDQVARGREMHWIRIDTYYAGLPNEPEFHHQPVPCMHCEHAPCELVCPVGATVHDDEGLNLQVYNRCVGTRYCSNNCPYKVRRFNFLEYNGSLSATEKLGKNPDVTVRSRGVMEKCTYCLQRINVARYAAELDNNRQIRDGEVVPACAQVCPAEAIVFGDIHDPNSRVSRLKKSSLNYGMLAELNTRPRTSYLAKLRNPNSDLA